MRLKIVVDTDMGVDDAAAVAWLVQQQGRLVELVGLCSVWGNTSAEHAAHNALALLGALELPSVPIAVGASGPTLGRPSRIGALAHGRDGMWGTIPRGGDPARLAIDAIAFYKRLAETQRGATLLAIGPLTNLARVLDEAPEALAAFERIVILGGARHHGTMTPVSETNFWHDPEAADRVLSARLPITLVTRDAHRAFALDADDVAAIVAGSSPGARHLAPAITAYAAAARRFGETVNLGDVVAAAVLVDRELATEVVPAFVRVVGSADPLVRGQSVMGITANEKLTLAEGGASVRDLVDRVAEDPTIDVRPLVGAALARARDNAEVVLAVDAPRIRAGFLEVLS